MLPLGFRYPYLLILFLITCLSSNLHFSSTYTNKTLFYCILRIFHRGVSLYYYMLYFISKMKWNTHMQTDCWAVALHGREQHKTQDTRDCLKLECRKDGDCPHRFHDDSAAYTVSRRVWNDPFLFVSSPDEDSDTSARLTVWTSCAFSCQHRGVNACCSNLEHRLRTQENQDVAQTGRSRPDERQMVKQTRVTHREPTKSTCSLLLDSKLR